jgi:hypothetical protein
MPTIITLCRCGLSNRNPTMNRHLSFAALFSVCVLSACGKDALQNITLPAIPSSGIRFFNFGVGAPSVNFYAGATKMTAVSSSSGTEATTGVSYGGVGAGGDYSALPPGQYTFTANIAAATDKDLPISSVATTIADGKYYSYYTSGVYNATTKSVDAFVVDDPFVAPTDFSIATVRFVNAIYNANPMTLYATSTTTTPPPTEYPIGDAVAYKNAGVFIQIPAGSYNLATRYAGSSTNALIRNNVSFLGGRVYTITARGDITVASSSATSCSSTNKTCLDNTANR